MTRRKKLIEVALPIEAINKESAREESINVECPFPSPVRWSRCARRPLVYRNVQRRLIASAQLAGAIERAGDMLCH
jgi:adenine-specific DNA methylase